MTLTALIAEHRIREKVIEKLARYAVAEGFDDGEARAEDQLTQIEEFIREAVAEIAREGA